MAAETAKPVRIGIIGCGNISGAYLKAAETFPILEVAACADIDPAAAARQAKAFGVPALSVEALLADPTIELVVNLTTPQSHVEVGLSAVAAGKHVYSEKPLSVTTASARRLIAAASAAGVRIGCAPDTFLGGAHQTARKAIDDGVIGRPVAGTAFFMNHGHEGWHPNPDFYYQAGGGPMLDMGPYYLTALVDFLGPVARVCGSTRTSFAERTITSQPRDGERIAVAVPTHLCGVLEFAGGTTVMMATSFDVWRHDHSHMELYGADGSMAVPDPNRFDGAVRSSNGKGDWAELPASHGYGDGNYRSIGVADMAQGIRRGRPHRASGALAYHVLEVMEAFERSSDTGRFVGIESRCERPAPLSAGPGGHRFD